MKILVAGDWHSTIHEEPVANALAALDQTVCRFPWHPYFATPTGRAGRPLAIAQKFQRKYMLGPSFSRMNRDLVATARREQPDALFIYRGTHIAASTLRRIRQTVPRVVIVGYNNDDPFSPRYPRWMWRHFRDSLPEYDLVLAYRQHNLTDFRNAGARRVELWRSWFIPAVNHPYELTPADHERYDCDVVFAGHFEADERVAYLDAIARAGYRLRIFGPDYPAQLDAPHLQPLLPIRAVRGEEYNKALCGAKIALCFLSKLNRDTYTRRNFEIPATRTLMLSEYTADLASLFSEDVEAAFFRSPQELLEKIAYYLDHDDRRAAVAAAGYQRVWADGHDITSRVRQLLRWIEALKGSENNGSPE